jgi:hypothetical protein
MAGGALSGLDERRTALGVAKAIGGRCMIDHRTGISRHAVDTDRDIRDMSGVVDRSTTLNTLSKGMRIQSDSLPPV